MNTIFMNSKNSKKSDTHGLLLKLTDKANLKISDKYVALWNLSKYYTCKNIKKSCRNKKFKISSPTWNEQFELPNGWYCISDIQDYIGYILKNMEEKLLVPQWEYK